MRTKLRRGAACALTSVMIGGALVACGDPSRQASGGEASTPPGWFWQTVKLAMDSTQRRDMPKPG